MAVQKIEIPLDSKILDEIINKAITDAGLENPSTQVRSALIQVLTEGISLGSSFVSRLYEKHKKEIKARDKIQGEKI